MRFIYSFLIRCYGLFIRIASLFNRKAKRWIDGRLDLFSNLENALKDIDRNQNPIIWFHVSSLGEFEQGRPVMEALRKRWPEKKLLLTFFSPSGYEVRKDYDQADFVFYLPLDTKRNAEKFVKIVHPEMVFFVKYDFWFNYIDVIHKNGLPLFFISVLFRKDQHFFRWYGGWTRSHLRFVTRFFVQNTESEELLRSIGIQQVTVAGDTRFDRVFAIAALQPSLPLIGMFCNGKRVFIAGSTWEPDEAMIIPMIRKRSTDTKYIIAPHDTSPERIRYIREHLDCPVVCFSGLNEESAVSADVLIIDSVGILAQLYRYADFAFIGGGFGGGIHNIQEPVTFGVPVFFGPNYSKFREARDLVGLGAAFVVTTPDELEGTVARISREPGEHQRLSGICRKYVEENRGATEKIVGFLEKVSG